MSLNLKIIIGSTRPGRVCPKIAAWVAESAIAHGQFNVEIVDLAEVNLPFLDEATHPRVQTYAFEHTKNWSAIVGSADAFIFVTPEYDFFTPAVTINAIQVLMNEWAYKCAGVVSYGGVSAGLRSAQTLRTLLSNVNVHAIPQVVPVPMFPQFMQDGVFTPNQPMIDGMTLQLNELAKWAAALKPMRA
ncbi:MULTISPECIES: NAD(P)H-dependent oxidoreductase [unclassified Devosia]|uniref:NADPH-dependent FMN reductase n=1 Tax=unclassified Devosia TaxID=196773 RepID=UPI00145FA649|nr:MULTISPECIES: NAD(P)H-dependent oxidoreductase [unclassified Devosia]MBJ6987688.1 NAD(P)H-dependent oxidoreductase [Devosia sp. MC521]QMW62366.1 NAD(P)H-dependent oxidoreductase [Devosia sp. MC521]